MALSQERLVRCLPLGETFSQMKATLNDWCNQPQLSKGELCSRYKCDWKKISNRSPAVDQSIEPISNSLTELFHVERDMTRNERHKVTSMALRA